MAELLSALKDHQYCDATDAAGITLQEVHPFSLVQIAAWPDTIAEVGAFAAEWSGCGSAPKPGQSATRSHDSLLRVEPLKWWWIARTPTDNLPDLADDLGAVLDLSHSRTWIRISGDKAETLLNHFLPLDLRDGAFPEGAVASSAFHHIGVTIWREASGYSLLIPRSFVGSLFEILTETARQYGLALK